MISPVRFLALATLVALLGMSPPAAADVPPANNCPASGGPPSALGQACDNAMCATGGYTGVGTCQASKCNHYGALEDGGLGVTVQSCVLCLGEDGGTTTSTCETDASGSSSGSSSGGSSGSSSGGAVDASTGDASCATSSSGGAIDASLSGGACGGSSATSGAPAPSSGGCAVTALGAQTLAPFGLMAAGALVLAASRRRERR